MHMEGGNERAEKFFSFLQKIQLGIGELSELSGITQRQLRYWEQKGYIKPNAESKGGRRYNATEAWKVLLIADYLQRGFTLSKAAELTEEGKKRHRLFAAWVHQCSPQLVKTNETMTAGEIYLGKLKDEDKKVMCHVESDENSEKIEQVYYYLDNEKD